MQTSTWTATAVIALAVGLVATDARAAALTIFHNNDGESSLLGFDDPADHGGIARAVSAIDQLRTLAMDDGRDVLTLSSGDNFLAGLTREASSRDGVDYDARALDLIGYDAVGLGNHDFDFGAEALADFIGYQENGVELLDDTTFLGANLDFTATPLEALADAGRVAGSTIVERDGNRYGIIGGITPRLAEISSPGPVAVTDFVTAINAEVAALEAQGIDKTILLSHVQGLGNDIETLQNADLGVDIVIAGGGDELLIDQTKLVDGEDVFGNEAAGVPAGAAPAGAADDTYPLQVTSNGKTTFVVTTTGNYQYWGRLNVEFDDAGNVVSVSGDPVVIGPNFGEDATAVERISDPVAATVDAIATEAVGTTDVALTNNRPDKRIREVNLGNLVADAFVWQAEQALGDELDGKAVIALQNSGGIRTNPSSPNTIEPGEITRATTLDLLPFGNSLTWTDDIDAAELIDVLEHSVSNVENVDGRFLQVSGIEFGFNPHAPEGDRVDFVRLADGTVIFDSAQGGLQPGAENIDLAIVTNNFTARGGDGFDTFAAKAFADLGFTYEQPLVNFIRDALGGVVGADAYPLGGEGRITETPLPGAVWLLGAGVAGLAAIRRRRRRA